MRDILLKSAALAVIALVSFSEPAIAEPSASCGPLPDGFTYCEGCDFCFATGFPYRIDLYICHEGAWTESIDIGFSTEEACEEELSGDGDICDGSGGQLD